MLLDLPRLHMYCGLRRLEICWRYKERWSTAPEYGITCRARVVSLSNDPQMNSSYVDLQSIKAPPHPTKYTAMALPRLHIKQCSQSSIPLGDNGYTLDTMRLGRGSCLVSCIIILVACSASPVSTISTSSTVGLLRL